MRFTLERRHLVNPWLWIPVLDSDDPHELVRQAHGRLERWRLVDQHAERMTSLARLARRPEALSRWLRFGRAQLRERMR